jgi:hypothetical protein
LSVVLSLLVAASLALSAFNPRMLALTAAAAAGLVGANWKLFEFFARARGLGFAAGSVPLLFLHYLASGVGYLWVRTGHAFARTA